MLIVTSVAIALSTPFIEALVFGTAFALGFAGQAAKVSVDATVQADVNDMHRGLVFALYDVLFNVAFVAATALAAVVLPGDGRSVFLLVTTSVCLAITAWWYFAVTPRLAPTAL
jgi:hypothetical protein